MAEIDDFVKFAEKSEYIGQNMQDAWILYETNHKHDGYFVDFGATDGLTINNTYMLEKELRWQGIVAEPNPVWHEALSKYRDCHISTECVWKKTGDTLKFLLTDAPDLATIQGFGNNDEHARSRITDNVCDVSTISLTDLLKKFNAPKIIDYLSIDTEGSEYDILYSFFKESFDDYKIDYITIEHNYVQEIRDKIYLMLTMNGYERKFHEISRCDDFYKRIK